MISLTVTYTDNLGPEADIQALLHKLAVRLKSAAGDAEPLLVAAQDLRAYVVVGEAEWATLSGVLEVPAAQAAAFDGLAGDLLAIADVHFAELYGRRSIALSFQRRLSDATLCEQQRRCPPDADTF